MSLPVWPPVLPTSLLAGASRSTEDPSIRTQMEVGPAKVRRRAFFPTSTWRGQLALSAEQVGSLDLFFRDTLVGGSLPFAWIDPVAGATVRARFAGPPELAHAGGERWVATLSLEILPEPTS